MDIQNINLNIHYTLPDEKWDKIGRLYTKMPNWIGYIDGIPHWYGKDNDEKMILASVEPSGLQFYAKMPEDEWNEWIKIFKKGASLILGFPVGEPEDGFIFYY